MTDLEMLELAAKAIGIKLLWSSLENSDLSPRVDGSFVIWNPLTNDGDTLRLAAALLIDIEWETEYIVFADGNFSEDIKDHGNDHAAAIRRSVVRAAAYRGENL